jgi:biotin operon repressor
MPYLTEMENHILLTLRMAQMSGEPIHVDDIRKRVGCASVASLKAHIARMRQKGYTINAMGQRYVLIKEPGQ